MTYQCLLIDHDDTLLTTFALRAQIMQHALERVFAVQVDAAVLLRDSHGQSLEQMAAPFSRDDAESETFVHVYRELYYAENTTGGLAPFPGVARTLERLHAAHIPMAVVTSKLGRGAEAELEHCNLREYFVTVIGSEHVTHPKPHPEALQLALEKLGCDASGAVMVGDTSADILGARAAGTDSGAALWGAIETQGLREAKPTYLLNTPAALLTVFGLD